MTIHMSITPRLCESGDLPGMLELMKHCYSPRFHERPDSFLSKIEASPETCWVMRNRSELSAYLITLPCRIDSLPVLDDSACLRPEDPDLFYIHDLAVHPNMKGRNLGTTLINLALAYATEHRFETACLVAVQGSAPFWKRFAFQEVNDLSAALREKLASYGDNAVFMTKKLQPPPHLEDLSRFGLPSPESLNT